MADVVHDDAGTASAENGIVLLDGPDGTALAATPTAARSTGEGLIQAAEDAEDQS